MFFTLPKTTFNISVTFVLLSANAFNLDQSKILMFGKELMTLRKIAFENIIGKGENAGNQHFLLFPLCLLHFFTPNFNYFNPFPNKPWFLRVCSTSLLKTLWEKEKLLIMSNFSFSHSVF